MGSNVSTTFIHCPSDCKAELGIKLPFLVLLIKNMHKYFCFEVKVSFLQIHIGLTLGAVVCLQIQDDQRFMRRFRVSNFQSKTSVKPFCTAMPMGMSPGWNQIQFNLADFTRRAYGSNYLETVSLQVHANVRIRRVYFTDKLYTEAELPNDYKLLGKPKDLKKEKQFKAPPTARPPSPLNTGRVESKTKIEEAAVPQETETEMDMGAPEVKIASAPEVSEAEAAPVVSEEPPAQTEPTEDAYYY